MTAADRLRAAVEAALPDGWLVLKPGFDDFREADSDLRALVLAAVIPIVEERDAEVARLRDRHNPEVCVDVQEHCEAQGRQIARLRAVLEWAGVEVLVMTPHPWARHRIESTSRAALRGDWPAVRAAGVVLPAEEG